MDALLVIVAVENEFCSMARNDGLELRRVLQSAQRLGAPAMGRMMDQHDADEAFGASALEDFAQRHDLAFAELTCDQQRIAISLRGTAIGSLDREVWIERLPWGNTASSRIHLFASDEREDFRWYLWHPVLSKLLRCHNGAFNQGRYAYDERIESGCRWLLSIRQSDRGWAILLRI